MIVRESVLNNKMQFIRRKTLRIGKLSLTFSMWLVGWFGLVAASAQTCCFGPLRLLLIQNTK